MSCLPPGSLPHRHADGAPPAGFPPPPGLPPPDVTRWPLRGAISLGLAALLVLVLGFGGWAVLAQLSGAVIAPGRIEAEGHRLILQHPEGGQVAEILVREGDTVAAGQPLLRLDGRWLADQLALTEAQEADNLARRHRLEAERDGRAALAFPPDLTRAAVGDPALSALLAAQARLFASRREGLAQAKAQLARQEAQVSARRDGIDAQTAALTAQRELIGRELADTRELFGKGLAQAPRLLALEREAARLDGQLAELAAARIEAEARRAELAILHLRQTSSRREDIDTELAALAAAAPDLATRRRDLAARLDGLELRAPAAGIVHQLTVTTPGAVLRGAEPILSLTPQGRPLRVTARIAPQDIGNAAIGQAVRLRFSALSGGAMPERDGMLTGLAPDIITDPASGIAYYSAEITLTATAGDGPADPELVPGMPVEVFIHTGRQSPLRYLLKPFADHLARALREG